MPSDMVHKTPKGLNTFLWFHCWFLKLFTRAVQIMTAWNFKLNMYLLYMWVYVRYCKLHFDFTKTLDHQKMPLCLFPSCPLSLPVEELNHYQASEAKGNVYVPVPVLRMLFESGLCVSGCMQCKFTEASSFLTSCSLEEFNSCCVYEYERKRFSVIFLRHMTES